MFVRSIDEGCGCLVISAESGPGGAEQMTSDNDKTLRTIFTNARSQPGSQALIELIRKVSKDDGFEVIVAAFCISEFGTDSLNSLTVPQLNLLCQQILTMKDLTSINHDNFNMFPLGAE